MGYCFSFGCSPLLVFLKDQASSHLIETIIQLSHKPLLRDLYKNHLKGHMVDLALHPIANFPIQRLTAASAKYKMVGNNCSAPRRHSQWYPLIWNMNTVLCPGTCLLCSLPNDINFKSVQNIIIPYALPAERLIRIIWKVRKVVCFNSNNLMKNFLNLKYGRSCIIPDVSRQGGCYRSHEVNNIPSPLCNKTLTVLEFYYLVIIPFYPCMITEILSLKCVHLNGKWLF